jgi:hypothetical protein
VQPAWTTCNLQRTRAPSTTTIAVRKLLQAYTQAHQVGGQEGQRLLQEAVQEIQDMPELKAFKLNKAAQAEGGKVTAASA